MDKISFCFTLGYFNIGGPRFFGYLLNIGMNKKYFWFDVFSFRERSLLSLEISESELRFGEGVGIHATVNLLFRQIEIYDGTNNIKAYSETLKSKTNG